MYRPIAQCATAIRAAFCLALCALYSLQAAPAAAAGALHVPIRKHPEPHLRPPTAAALYAKYVKSDDLYSYRGRQVTTYWRTGTIVEVIVYYRAPGMRRLDYVAPYSERGRSVATDGANDWQYDPQSSVLIKGTVAPNAEAIEDATENYGLLRRNYLIAVMSSPQVVAERKTYVLAITRRSDHTTARKMWIDADTGVVLKRESFRQDGRPYVTTAFTDIAFRTPVPRALFDLSFLGRRRGVRVIQEPPSGERPVALADLARQLGGAAVVEPQLGGFKLVSAALTQTSSLHLRYSDGLNMISLFEQRRRHLSHPTSISAGMRPTEIGRTRAHVGHHKSLTALNWDWGNINMTLMGEISEQSLRLLAGSIAGTPPARR